MLLNLSPPVLLLLWSSLSPVLADDAAGDETAQTVDRASFWLAFVLLVVISSIETAASIVWTRIRVTFNERHPCELSYRVCGREVSNTIIDMETAIGISNNGLPLGIYYRSSSSETHTENDVVTYHSSRSNGCSSCGGFETQRSSVNRRTKEAVINKFFSIMLVPTLLIRRFNLMTSLQAPTGLANNIRGIVRASMDGSLGLTLDNLIHLLLGLIDVALGVAGLVLVPGSPKQLYNTLKDVEAPMSFENYLTLFLLSWLLGALLLIFILPLRSSRRSVQIFGVPGVVAFSIASLANLALFGLGCWKIDHARRTQQPWTPMLSYWVGGASSIDFSFFGIEVFHVFGVVGLVFMVKHIFFT